MPAIIWPGEVGDTWTNTSDKIVYQFHVSGINTCGLCWQFDGAISSWWSKQHRGCNCISTPIYPLQTSAPYEDWREKIRELPEDQQKKVMGASNMALVESGTVKWDDVVTSNRVRNFREVVARQNLTVKEMTNAGVRPQDAAKAHATVHTPAHQLAEEHRASLVKQILDLGVKPQHLTEMFGEKMAQRIGIKWGPSGAAPIPGVKTDREWVRILTRSLAARAGAITRAVNRARELQERAAAEEAERVRLEAEAAQRAVKEAAGPSMPEFGMAHHTIDTRGDATAMMQDMFGPDVTFQQVSNLTGAPDGAKVVIRTYGSSRLSLRVFHPTIDSMVRTIRKHRDGKISIHNDRFFLTDEAKKSKQKLGPQYFGRQVENARKMGVSWIDTDAGRSSTMNGYYVWPRLGYNHDIEPSIKDKLKNSPSYTSLEGRTGTLPENQRKPKSILDLMQTQEGRDWWQDHGQYTTGMEFDLKEGSRSLQVHEAYQKEIAAKKAGK